MSGKNKTKTSKGKIFPFPLSHPLYSYLDFPYAKRSTSNFMSEQARVIEKNLVFVSSLPFSLYDEEVHFSPFSSLNPISILVAMEMSRN